MRQTQCMLKREPEIVGACKREKTLIPNIWYSFARLSLRTLSSGVNLNPKDAK